LDRWVSLAKKGTEPEYGLYYAATTEGSATVGTLRGFAWGGDVVGWMSFGGPVLKSVTPLGGGAADVTWENPMSYQRIEIQRSLPNQTSDPTRYRPSKTFDESSGAEYLTAGEHTFRDSGLGANEERGYFIRGYPQ
ncbi:MAG: hypothetical protein V1696_02795, partial [Candidatus Jorgensenbacteria bacterium]